MKKVFLIFGKLRCIFWSTMFLNNVPCLKKHLERTKLADNELHMLYSSTTTTKLRIGLHWKCLLSALMETKISISLFSSCCCLEGWKNKSICKKTRKFAAMVAIRSAHFYLFSFYHDSMASVYPPCGPLSSDRTRPKRSTWECRHAPKCH